MALVKCPECQEAISDTAAKCPRCAVVLRKPKRTFLGKIVKYGFIAFNLLMLFWFISAMGSTAEVVESATSEAERAGAAIGTGIGMMLLFGIWGFGDIVGGIFLLLTRPK